eukprot:TRINITY_DN112638_c0_g1_i1.p1 TRINITY_DN112638_c0_g1~~TRINITY_DN112638_c0_g1_i1.p1  ORF type:complete len:260 (-),score=34.63 TRINITY_DN112638_c0_g1_i1:203-982(-)
MAAMSALDPGGSADGNVPASSQAGAARSQVTDRRAAARQRQVDIGKARPEYLRYLQCVPKDQRTPTCPRTPDPWACVSKRQFDRQLSEWRRQLHEYDDPEASDTQGHLADSSPRQCVPGSSSSTSSRSSRLDCNVDAVPQPAGIWALPRVWSPDAGGHNLAVKVEIERLVRSDLCADGAACSLPPPGLGFEAVDSSLAAGGYVGHASNPWAAVGPAKSNGFVRPEDSVSKDYISSSGQLGSGQRPSRDQLDSPEGCPVT